MAMSVTVTKSGQQSAADVRKVIFDWVSAADGTATGATNVALSGAIARVVFDPGTPAPTALYDVTITDENGFDVLAGQGANLSATVTSAVCPGVAFKDGTTTSIAPVVVDGILTLNVSNAGDSKAGSVVLYLR